MKRFAIRLALRKLIWLAKRYLEKRHEKRNSIESGFGNGVDGVRDDHDDTSRRDGD